LDMDIDHGISITAGLVGIGMFHDGHGQNCRFCLSSFCFYD
jgi:hypothetical protein